MPPIILYLAPARGGKYAQVSTALPIVKASIVLTEYEAGWLASPTALLDDLEKKKCLCLPEI
jgi:hypothetical protein